ncbi:MAG: F0F1 ATP synthase subunit delta [Acetobacteraceae bacterium]|nr:F0F1 ATP synthase subunit delta [Acetobacteraceae bacterium]
MGGVAQRYAAALYARADETGQLDEAVEQMEALGRLIDESADFRRLLGDPTIDAQAASRAALTVLDREGFGKLVHDFVGVIAANRRLRSLRGVVAAFAALVAEKRGVVVAEVATAHPLTDVQREQLRGRLIEAGYGQVRIQESVDPSLLGGLVVRVGSRLYDTSLKSRLQRLQYAMKGAA